VPGVPATLEATAGGSLESRVARPAWAIKQDSISIKKKEKIPSSSDIIVHCYVFAVLD
jgi:hypothetical protein